MSKKIYVLDTNILIDAPDAIYGFDDNIVVITGTVLQELDKHKTTIGETGYNTRTAIRTIENIAGRFSFLQHDYQLNNGGTLMIYAGSPQDLMPYNFSLDVPDNRILNDILALSSQYDGARVILVSNDVSMRLNARAVGIEAQSYQNVQVRQDEDYTGRVVIDCNDLQARSHYLPDLEAYGQTEAASEDIDTLVENEYVVIANNTKKVLTYYRDGKLTQIQSNMLHPMGIRPRNEAQIMALHALLAPASDIPLVILRGPAGTAKTLLSVAAGVSQTMRLGENGSSRADYNQVLLARCSVLADKDPGSLPGDLFDKLRYLHAPVFDALEVIFGHNGKEDPAQIQMQIEDLFDNSIMEIQAMAFIRGRSLAYKYLILDEAQNATRMQIKTTITRASEGCKIVICGDNEQIDTPKLDQRNNGLVYAQETMRGSKACAQIVFKNNQSECQRGWLASEAIARMR